MLNLAAGLLISMGQFRVMTAQLHPSFLLFDYADISRVYAHHLHPESRHIGSGGRIVECANETLNSDIGNISMILRRRTINEIEIRLLQHHDDIPGSFTRYWGCVQASLQSREKR